MYQTTYVVNEPKEFTRHYETASWFKTVLVPAGAYPIKYVDIGGHETTPEQSYYGVVKMDGIVTRSCFVNRLFSSSSVEIDKCKGEPETITLQIYSYLLKEKPWKTGSNAN